MPQQTQTVKLPKPDNEVTARLKTFLAGKGFRLRELQDTAVSGVGTSSVVTLYTTGRLVVQGADAESVASMVLAFLSQTPQGGTSTRRASVPNVSSDSGEPVAANHLPAVVAWIGTDESGKGDYFGPLVIAGVLATQETAPKIVSLGVRDSKTLSDERMAEMAPILRRELPTSIVAIGPEKYNQLIDSMGNLNRLLAWGHARCIENILAEHQASLAIADQFGDERFIKNALMTKGKAIELEQHPRAEADPAVAAASVLARTTFVRLLHNLSQSVGVELPKGAGPQVDEVARRLYSRDGPEILRRITKYHFRTTEKVTGARTRYVPTAMVRETSGSYGEESNFEDV